jgi:probable phosphoglycerate mutase
VARGAILGIEDALVPYLDVPQDKVLRLRDATMLWL